MDRWIDGQMDRWIDMLEGMAWCGRALCGIAWHKIIQLM